jgi:CHAT domain-containing protein/tetratricopeptide (TPR) repeat protein
MLPTKRIRSTTVRLLSLLAVCLCIGWVFRIPKTTSIASEAPASDNVQPPKAVTPLDRKNSEARQAMADAERLCADWKEDSLRQAIQQYDKAISIWTSVPDFAAAANAALKSGDVYFLFSEYKEALKRYQNAEALAVKAGDWLVQATALSRIGRLNSYVGDNTLAQKQLAKALDLFKGREANLSDYDANAHGEVLSSLAEVNYAKGDLVTSSELLEKALKFLENDRKGQARVHLFMGYIAGGTGDPEKAAAQISKALELYRAIKNKSGEGLALITLGLLRTSKGDTNEAIKLHREAIESFRAIGDRHSEAIAHNALGQVFYILSDYPLALDNYEQALRLFESIGSVEGVAVSSFKIAEVNRKRGDLDQALAALERCLKLSRAAGKRRSEADALNEIASVYVSQDRFESALRQYEKAYKFYQSIADRRGQATALNTHGDLLLQVGQKQKALEAYRRALLLSREVGDKGILLTALYNIARANLELGFPDTALSFVEESLEIIEHQRANVGSPDFRTSYFSGVRQHYSLCVRILMDLERLRPGKGFAFQAFQVNEKSRGRALIDLISESYVDLQKGVSGKIIKRERELGASIRAMAQYEWDLSLKGDSPERAEVVSRLAKLRSEYQEIQAYLRQQNPHLQTLERSALIELKQVQKELQDSNTLLLEYASNDEGSYLWAVTSNSFQSYELPAGKDIEAAAREFYGAITARQAATDQAYQAKVNAADNVYLETGRRLSQMLLGPVAPQLNSKSLLFVTEGALQFIPFEALPVPVSDAAQGVQEQVLLETNEISALPSFSTLIAIRAMPSRTVSPERTVAVIADPVFNDNDDRVQREEGTSGIASAAPGPSLHPSVQQGVDRVMRDSGASRLIYASEEADAILAAAPSGTTIVARGFDATRETAMSSHVGQYQIVHFATHGFLNNEHPELSAIVLTMVDRNGAKTNGLMPLHDIYSLDLSAELTVLSACQTALGKDIKGEGPVGLTHSFISAGSKSVVASLWKVDDRATAALMRDFYESLLQEGMPTAKALRSAKLKMLRDKRWSAPYFWAGFVLQGEYTNRIAVDNSWRRPHLLAFSLTVIVIGLIVVFQIRRRRFTKTPRT